MRTALVAGLSLVGGILIMTMNYEAGCSPSPSGTICAGPAAVGSTLAALGVVLAGVLGIFREAADPTVARAAIGLAVLTLLLALAGQMIPSLVVASMAAAVAVLLGWRTRRIPPP